MAYRIKEEVRRFSGDPTSIYTYIILGYFSFFSA